MKLFQLLSFILFISTGLNSQTITGIVVDANNNGKLEYASIGIINTPLGTITSEIGEFKLNVSKAAKDATVRISMIGYEPQTFNIDELINKENLIKLVQKPIQIAETTVKANSTTLELGTTGKTLKGGVCGWGGNQFGMGHEIGLQISLGSDPVKVQTLHVRMHKQSYDSSLFRLHIRDIENKIPNKELLASNVLIPLTQKSGWIEIDLSGYDLKLSGDIALSLEWLEVLGLNENNMVRVNDAKQKTANVLLSVKKDQECLFIKKGVEAKWIRVPTQSPSMYLTVLK